MLQCYIYMIYDKKEKDFYIPNNFRKINID